MQLTIIPIDGTVIKDGVGYLNIDLLSCGIPNDVHALQWFDNKGWIEYESALIPNENITVLPSWADCCLTLWELANTPVQPVQPTAEQNKQSAILLLQQTDWTQIPSVSDPAVSNPYLANKNAFDIYRNSVRQYALNPVSGNITFPTMPTDEWTSA